jgi:hypothetical protein
MMIAMNSNDTGYSPVAGCFAHNNEHYLPKKLEISELRE